MSNGHTFLFHCMPTDLVQTLMYSLADVISFDSNRFFLIYEGKKLETDRPLSFYNIPKGSVVSLMFILY